MFATLKRIGRRLIGMTVPPTPADQGKAVPAATADRVQSRTNAARRRLLLLAAGGTAGLAGALVSGAERLQAAAEDNDLLAIGNVNLKADTNAGGTNGTGDIVLYTRNVERARVANDGNVTIPGGVTIGTGDSTKTLAVTTDTDGRTFFRRDDENYLVIQTNGSLVMDPTHSLDVPSNDLSQPNHNRIGRVGLWYNQPNRTLWARGMVVRDVGNSGSLTLGRTGHSDRVTRGALQAGTNIGQIWFQGDLTGDPAVGSDFKDGAARILVLAEQNFTATPHNQPGRMFFQTQRRLARGRDQAGTNRLAVGPDGSFWIYPLTDTLLPTGTGSVTNMLNFYNDAGVLKIATTAGVARTLIIGLTGSTIWTPGSLANGAQATTTVTVTGATAGDPVVVGFSQSLQGQMLTGYVGAADTVTVVLQNESGGTLDLASGTLKATVLKS